MFSTIYPKRIVPQFDVGSDIDSNTSNSDARKNQAPDKLLHWSYCQSLNQSSNINHINNKPASTDYYYCDCCGIVDRASVKSSDPSRGNVCSNKQYCLININFQKCCRNHISAQNNQTRHNGSKENELCSPFHKTTHHSTRCRSVFARRTERLLPSVLSKC